MKQDLIGSASLENRQVFGTVPTLGELQYFLSVVCDELTVFKAWPVCYLVWISECVSECMVRKIVISIAP